MIILLIQKRYCSAVLVLFLMLWTTGCNTLPLNVWEKHRVITASAEHPVIELVGIWQTAEGQDQKNLPCRGFGGQILFFAAGQKSPVKVEGNVSIYVFDDVGTPEDQAKPYHQYDFTSEQWNCFFRDSTLGPCYQVFVPYTRPGGFEADCSIRVKYTPDAGMPVYSKVATINIRGVKRNNEYYSKKLARESSRLVTQANSQQSEQEQLISSIMQAKHEQLKHEVIPTHTPQSTINKNLQEQRLHKLEHLLDTFDPDPHKLESSYQVTNTRIQHGNPVGTDHSSIESQEKHSSSDKLEEIFGVE